MKHSASKRDPSTKVADTGHVGVNRALADPQVKQEYVTALFDLVAPRYDRFTRWFSYGMDAGWKRELCYLIGRRFERAVTLDLACGTGDLLTLASSAARTTIGVDPSSAMLLEARARNGSNTPGVCLCRGTMMRIPVRDTSIDVVTVGYGLRNTPAYATGLREIHRVLKPGGHVATLDFYRPTTPLWNQIFLAYLSLSGKLYGLLWHGEPAAYGYIATSIRQYMSAEEFARALNDTGFVVEAVRTKLGGGIGIHIARKVG